MLSQDRESRESNRDVLLHDAGFGERSSVIQVTVRREYLYEDAFNDLSERNGKPVSIVACRLQQVLSAKSS